MYQGCIDNQAGGALVCLYALENVSASGHLKLSKRQESFAVQLGKGDIDNTTKRGRKRKNSKREKKQQPKKKHTLTYKQANKIKKTHLFLGNVDLGFSSSLSEETTSGSSSSEIVGLFSNLRGLPGRFGLGFSSSFFSFFGTTAFFLVSSCLLLISSGVK